MRRPREVIDSAGRRLDDERFALGVLLAAAATFVALGLWLTRGGSFIVDELAYYSQASGYAPAALAEPFGGHLTAVNRLLYAVYTDLFGSSHLPFQLTTLVVNVGVAVLIFKLLARSVGAYAALAGGIAVLFLGSTPVGIQANAAMWGQATMFGLAALLALGSGGRRADPLACAALVLAVLSLEVGVAFAVGAAVWIAIDDRSPRRLWIAAIPIALYAGWWLWALQFDQGFATLSNVLLAPAVAADSAAAALASLSGLGLDLVQGPSLSSASLDTGRVLVVGVLAVVGLALWRRPPGAAWWGTAAMLVVFWIALAIGYGPLRGPEVTRYAFVVVAGLLPLVGWSVAGWRPDALARLGLALALACSLAGNLWLLRERGAEIRSASELSRARLAVVELHPEAAAGGLEKSLAMTAPPAEYLSAAAEQGSLGIPPGELDVMSETQAAEADRTLAQVAPPVVAPAEGRCAGEGAPVSSIELGPEVVLRSENGAELRAARFAAQPSVEVGELPPGRSVRVSAPADAAAQPWLISAEGGSFVVCESPPG